MRAAAHLVDGAARGAQPAARLLRGTGWRHLSHADVGKGKINRVDHDFGSTSTASNRDSQSNRWIKWKIMGQPCEFQVPATLSLVTEMDSKYGSKIITLGWVVVFVASYFSSTDVSMSCQCL
jgi:hypothetical protein